MVAIRNRNTNVPHVFRYPQWEEDIFYPAGSLVSYPVTNPDSDGAYWDFYVAKVDIESTDNVPPTDNFLKYKLILSTSTVGDSEVNALLLQLDSDIQILQDSVNLLINYDSELKAWLDSEVRERIENDSDIQFIKNSILSRDSDLDSELNQIRHDFISADSDSLSGFDSDLQVLKDHDSDFKVVYDSDLTKTYHDFKAADSDVNVNVDSDLQVLKDYDSDFKANYDSDLSKTYHDFTAADSDLRIFDLLDVKVNNIQDRQVLMWDDSEQKWINIDLTSVSGNDYDYGFF